MADPARSVRQDGFFAARGRPLLLSRADLLLLLAVFATRFGCTAYCHSPARPVRTTITADTVFDFGDDGTAYFDIARSLARGDGYRHFGEPDIRWPPLYPFVLAGIIRVAGERPWVVPYVHAAFDVATALLLLLFTRRLSGGCLPARVAVLLFAVMPGFAFYHTAIMTESVFALIMVAMMHLHLVALQQDSRRHWAWGCAALGLSILCRGTLLLYPPCLAALVFWLKRHDPLPRRLSWAALGILVPLVIVLPWTVRASALAGRFVPVSLGGAHPFLIGVCYENDAVDLPRSQAWHRLLGEVLQRQRPGQTCAEQRAHWEEEALSVVRERIAASP